MHLKRTTWLGAILFASLANQAAVTAKKRPAPATPLNHPEYGKIPLAFEPNLGQTGGGVRYLARGGGMTAFFTEGETDMVLSRNGQQTVVRMKLEGSARPRRIVGVDKQPGISNYFIGNNPSQWHTNVPHYGRIQYQGVYPGIDLVWYGNQRHLEYDFVVGPGADPARIQVAYQGVESLQVEANGDLLLRTALGEMRQQKPKVYQEMSGQRVEVAAHYSIVARNRVGFELARYDRQRELRIDPVVLAYSTYLGGGGPDYGQGIAVDATGSAYITGSTESTNFPTLSADQTALAALSDVFVTKLTPAGDALVYSTYLGGNNYDAGQGIAVDAAGSAYITGYTESSNYPTKSPFQATLEGSDNAFVTKLTPAGNALAYSTYLGGGGDDSGQGIAVDAAGSAYIAGSTTSTNFPTKSPYQATLTAGADDFNAFVTKLTPAGNALVYSTYLGGTGSDIAWGVAVDEAGSAYVGGSTTSTNFPTKSPFQAATLAIGQGSNGFVTKMTPAGTGLAYSTYLGGSGSRQGGADGVRAIAVDRSGSAYVTGRTYSSNFPTKSPFEGTLEGETEAFVTKLAPSGSSLVYSTFLGGTGANYGQGIAVDAAGSAYVTGYTYVTDFPTVAPYQATNHDPSLGTAFVTKLTPPGNALVYSTYLGGSSGDYAVAIAVDPTGSSYVTGNASSTNFPTQSAYQATLQASELGAINAFVTKFSPFGAGAPFGSFDTPSAASSNVDGSVGFTGWALSEAGIASVGIYRNPNPGEATQSNGLVYIGTASSITGSRTDIAALYPSYPESTSAGWGFLILTNELPSNSGNTGVGNGTYNIHAIALDLGGNSKDLGVKTIVVDNKTSVTPFGGIDTPAQGATVSGTAYVNFGWALTPLPNMIATNGSTINVLIDAKPVGHPVYNNPRADIEALFPGYANTDGAVGYFKINTTTLTNGLHQISWSVTDSAGHKTGIGSRFFIVQN